MVIFAYYLLKVLICSGILYAYYLVALHNKVFHEWNRFYLLAAVVLSLATPLVKINVAQKADEPVTQVAHFLQLVNSNDEVVYQYTKTGSNVELNASDISAIIYIVICGVLLAFLIQSLYKINRLKNKYQQTVLDGIIFINTDADGTPFSFFNTIFWNNKIDINSLPGRQIFRHEVAHVQEKHTYDKIFMNIVLIFFWSNPFFWLIRKELNMIHEFIADHKAVEDGDTSAFAAMILKAGYPRQQFNISSSFFYSPIKRRLIMLVKNNNPKISYVSRMLVLPFAALVFFAFTLKMETPGSAHKYTGKRITVVIDAGHGGNDNGAKSENGVYEKDITLSIAKKVRDLNNNKNINIVLSRDKDETITVKQRVEIASSLGADLFISIHLGADLDKNTTSGLGIIVPGNNNPYLTLSKKLGAGINESFKNNYQLPVADDLKQPGKGIWVLKANQYPAVLIEAGFLTTKTDLEYLLMPSNQQTIARNILEGIEKYAQQNLLNENSSIPARPGAIPSIKTGAKIIDSKNFFWVVGDKTEKEKC